jgi:hypothetical protein
MTEFEKGFHEELEKLSFLAALPLLQVGAASAAGLYGANKLRKKVFGGGEQEQPQQQVPSPVVNVNTAMPQQEQAYNPMVSGMTY